MEIREKNRLLNELITPFGFSYSPSQDIMYSIRDAWQRGFGYHAIYDKTASHFNMVLDCEPVYFYYDNRTWLIEFWKGQYGINIGGEIGIYYADSLLPVSQFDRTLFHSVPDNMLLPISIELFYKGSFLFFQNRLHWWLAGFRMGLYCEPEDLVMDASVTFPDRDMLQSFTAALRRMGHSESDLVTHDLTAHFTFSSPHSVQPRVLFYFRARIAQWKNRSLCKIYHWCTLPFSCTLDQLLYLYFLVPFAFTHMLCFKRNRKQKFPGKGGK